MHKLQELLPVVQKAIDAIAYPEAPAELYNPIRYELSLGGKRIRPILTLMACEMFGCDYLYALDTAVGIEVFHNFTLLHDDVMDKADMRRGKPTVHNYWNENAAILSGDAMQIMAFMQVMKAPEPVRNRVAGIFLKTALEICEGQQYDMDFEVRSDVTDDEYIEMIRLKTAVLLGAALQVGAVIAGASDSDSDTLYNFGINIGLAFQLRDDYLDVYGDSDVFGKNIGGDILNNKKTYMLINACRLSQGEDRKTLSYWLSADEYVPSEKIEAVTAVYNKIGVDRICLDKIEYYYAEALKCLDALSIDREQTILLRELAMKLMQRNS